MTGLNPNQYEIFKAFLDLPIFINISSAKIAKSKSKNLVKPFLAKF